MPKQKQKNDSAHHTIHKPVLLNEVLRYLQPEKGQTYLDLTAGFGGHAKAVLERTLNPSGAYLVDRDEQAIIALQKRFANDDVTIIRKDFLSASEELVARGSKFDMIFADLGVSSLHLNEATRGFMFSMSGPLDMRMDRAQELTAEEIVNGWNGPEIARILREYGEEPKAEQIARLIVASRPVETTEQLASIASKAWPGHSRVHPATRTFQALRIVVNSELTQLEKSLPLWLELLSPKGRLAVISFHSLEDRIVKRFFQEHAQNTYDSELIPLTKKPVVAQNDEIVSNPRARSAKLRATQRK